MPSFRYATYDDVSFIVGTQRQPDVAAFVGFADDEEISASIVDAEQAYLIALDDCQIPVGFAYLRQLGRPERSIELHRLAIANRNKGYGSEFLKLILVEAFGPLNANRLWLDVFPENARAEIYTSGLGSLKKAPCAKSISRMANFPPLLSCLFWPGSANLTSPKTRQFRKSPSGLRHLSCAKITISKST